MAISTIQQSIIGQLKELNKPITAPELAKHTGIALDELEDFLEALLKVYPCKLDVSKEGQLIYDFDIINPPKPVWWKNPLSLLKKAGELFFKVWIALMLVGYVWIYIPNALIIAPIVCLIAVCSLIPIVLGLIIYAIVTDPGNQANKFESHQKRLRKFFVGKRVFIYGKGSLRGNIFHTIFSYVFGEPFYDEESAGEKDRRILNYIATHQQQITAVELTFLTGKSLEEAAQEAIRLMNAYRGEVSVSDQGALIYSFPEIEEDVLKEYARLFVWQRLSPAQSWNNNYTLENGAITMLISFLLTLSFISLLSDIPIYWIEWPIFNSHLFPLSFSLIFMALAIWGRKQRHRANQERIQQSRYYLLLRKLFEQKFRPISYSQKSNNHHLLAVCIEAEVQVDNAGMQELSFPQASREVQSVLTLRGEPWSKSLYHVAVAKELEDVMWEASDLAKISRYIRYEKGENSIVLHFKNPSDASNILKFIIYAVAVIVALLMLLIFPNGTVIFIGGIIFIVSFIKSLILLGALMNTNTISITGKKGNISSGPIPLVGANKRFDVYKFESLAIKPEKDYYIMNLNLSNNKFSIRVVSGIPNSSTLEEARRMLYLHVQEQLGK